MSGSGREALPDVQEWSRALSGCPGVVETACRMSGRGRKALSNVREWSGGPPKCPVVVVRPSRTIRRFV